MKFKVIGTGSSGKSKRLFEDDIVKKFGFCLTHHFEHDDWETLRYGKGNLTIDFTYQIENGMLDSISLKVEEVDGLEVGFEDLQHLDRILNKN